MKNYYGFFKYDSDKNDRMIEAGGIRYWAPMILLVLASIALFITVVTTN